MFKALKEKLFSARKKLENSIEETTPEPARTLDEVLAGSGSSSEVLAEKTPDLSPEKKISPKFTDKVVSFVRDREFIISEKDVSGILDEL